MNAEQPYVQRDPISAKAFSVRHLLIEEIKRRLSFMNLSPREIELYRLIANTLDVQTLGGQRGYLITVDNCWSKEIPHDSFRIYSRGDRPTDKENIPAAGELVDPILLSNRLIAKNLLSIIVSDLSGHESVAPTIFNGISCVFPCLNEEMNIESAVEKLRNALVTEIEQNDIIAKFEILVIDDGSTDETASKALALKLKYPEVRLIQHPRNLGYGAALYSGFTEAKFDLVFFADSDNQFDYSEIRQILPRILTADAVCGIRANRQDPPLRRLNALGWNCLIRLCFGYLVKDIDCAFKLFRMEALRKVDLRRIRGKGAIINTEILVRFKSNNARFEEVAVSHLPRLKGQQTGANLKVITRAFWELFKLNCCLITERLGYLGFVTGFFSRSNRPLEVLEFRRSTALPRDSKISCPLCQSAGNKIRQTNLQTCSDLSHLGTAKVFLCCACRNAFTIRDSSRVQAAIEPDLEGPRLGYLESKLLNYFTSIRVRRVLNAYSRSGSLRILDCGAGNCAFAGRLAALGHSVTAIEPNGDNIKFVKDLPNLQFLDVPFELETLKRHGITNNSLDIITFWHSLEHFEQPLQALKAAYELLRPGGLLYICVPNLNSLQAEIGGNSWAYLDVPRHLFHFSTTGLLQMLPGKGFQTPVIHWFSLEYEFFGWYQTILNMVSRSHNYLYNHRKKGVELKQLQYPIWTKMVNTAAPIFLPFALLFGLWSSMAAKPSCVEVHCFKRTDT